MWPKTREELISVQNLLGMECPESWEPATPVRVAGGCFICYPKKHSGKGIAGDRYWAAAVCIQDNQLKSVRVATGVTTAAYEPGFLALREGPLLSSVLRALSHKPEVLLVNATGRDHPRRAGLALHLGFCLSLPSIGVTRNPLIATGDWPADFSGANSPLRIGEGIVGYWLRVKQGSPPLAVHAAWRTTPEIALGIVTGLMGCWRTPEPLRQARRAAREARAKEL